MKTGARSVTFRLVGLLLLAAATAGCTVAPHFERGPKLSTEQRNVVATPEYALQGAGHTDRVPPTLVVWLDRRVKTSAEERDIYQKVEVSGRRSLSFEPTFFLWPYNVVRVPVGLVGLTFVGLDMGLHYVAGFMGAGLGVVTTIVMYAALNTISLFQVGDITGYGLAADLTQLFVFLFETPLAVLDLPLKPLFGTTTYPIALNRKSFPERWAQAMGASWHHAWDFHAYPPFFIWMRTEEIRRDVPGETLAGGWTPGEQTGDWKLAGADSYIVESGGHMRVVQGAGGLASINLAELASGMDRSDTLDVKVTAQTPQGAVSGRFSFNVADLLPAP